MASSTPLLLLLLVLFATATLLRAALPEKPTAAISSNSVLIALLDSHYTQFSELIEKASLLQTLEQSITTNNHNLTTFAPTNEALDLDLDPEFKRFLLEPGNIQSLQTLILHHILPVKLTRRNWPNTESTHRVTALSRGHVLLSCGSNSSSSCNDHHVDNVQVLHLDSVNRPDGVIHAIGRVIIPNTVQHEFNNRRNLRSISAVKPEPAPETDPRVSKKLDNSVSFDPRVAMPPAYAASAPGPGPAHAPGGRISGEKQVDDFIQTLMQYGGYNEMADILVNLTSLATEMGKLINEGYSVTVLAPNDEAMAKLTADRLSEPGSPEQIMYYHILTEYQTEESMYNAVRRFGTVSYDTLRVEHKVVAREADGSVRFGESDDSGYLFDPDIYTDGRISVQGIDGVLFPPEERMKKKEDFNGGVKGGGQNVKKIRRGT